jgi:hypothetical protein
MSQENVNWVHRAHDAFNTNELEVDEARSSLLTLRDGRIVRIEPFASKDGALEAPGLPVNLFGRAPIRERGSA